MPVVSGLLNGIICPTCLIICCYFGKCDESALDRRNLCVIIFMRRLKRAVRMYVKVLAKGLLLAEITAVCMTLNCIIAVVGGSYEQYNNG